MIKVRVGTTWKFNSGEGSIQKVVSINNDLCKVINIKGDALWGREPLEPIDISYVEDALNGDPDYKVITHYNTKLGKILYK